MPTVSKCGDRKASRRNWRDTNRPRSRPGLCPRPRPNPFSQLVSGLRALVRFHEAHSDWFPPVEAPPPPLDSEWQAAIQRAYGHTPSPDLPRNS